MQLLVSHLGYSLGAPNAAIAVRPESRQATLLRADGTVVAELDFGPPEQVAGWHLGPFARIPLPRDLPAGTYVLQVGAVRSAEFTVAASQIQRQTISDVLSYFKAMRSSGEIDRKDRQAALWEDPEGRTVDARGGWLDASGDTSKFLSHLTYTGVMSPQQIPLCAWAMLAARDALATKHPTLPSSLRARLRDEALWGADFLYRFRAPEGYFYTGIFDALTKRLEERVVTAPLQNSVRTSRYQAGYRQGGGLAIAALARASQVDDDGDFTRADYLTAAVDGFRHLEQHNLEYLFDGTESIVDDYCALLAATELVAAGVDEASDAAHRRARSLITRYKTEPPFVHAVEAGLPLLALLRYADVFSAAATGTSAANASRAVAAFPAAAAGEEAPGGADAAVGEAGVVEAARETALLVLGELVDRTHVVANPFGYPRQRDAFFFPHDNETGYWWQGENATIASLAAAANACAEYTDNAAVRARFEEFAADQLAWICGRNPYDVSMIQGRGRNNVDYESDFPNLPGGIVNGITSGWTDEDDIAFLPPDAPPGDAWRWAEQWIPHTGWFLLAVATQQ